MRILTGITLSLVVLAAASVRAGAQAIDQLPGGSYDAYSSDLPVPQAVPAESPSSFPSDAEFLVKAEAEHDSGVELSDPLEISYGKSASPSAPRAIPYLAVVKKEAEAQDVDPSLILAIIQKESSFDPKAHNKSGAVGLMQVLPSTAKWLGLKDTKQLWAPAVNIKYGVKYLKYLFGEFGEGSLAELKSGDLQNAGIRSTLAAYNAGPGNVRKYKGVPPFHETRHYVELVAEYFMGYDSLPH